MNTPDNTNRPSTAIAPRAIEVGFPIVEINRLAESERNSFKPIYQMHKWFARRSTSSCAAYSGVSGGCRKGATCFMSQDST